MNRKNITTAIIIIIGLILLVLVGRHLWLEKKEKTNIQPADNEQLSVVENGFYYYKPVGLKIPIPEEWEDKYKISVSENDKAKIISFNYIDSHNQPNLLMSLSIYPFSTKILKSISEESNQKIVAENSKYIIIYSSSLEMPFKEGTTDFENYAKMVDKVNEMLAEISFTSGGVYARTKTIKENGPTENENEKKETKKYTIQISYPEFLSSDDTYSEVLTSINKETKKFVDNSLKSFKNNLTNLPSIEVLKNVYSHYQLNYQIPGIGVEMGGHTYISVLYSDFRYYIGMAHPITQYISKNYDLTEGGKEIKIDDIITSNETLKKITETVKEKLAQEIKNNGFDPNREIDEKFLTPKKENFSSFNLSPNGIVFNFNPGIVASRYLGAFHITIPYSVIENN